MPEDNQPTHDAPQVPEAQLQTPDSEPYPKLQTPDSEPYPNVHAPQNVLITEGYTPPPKAIGQI